MISKKTLSTSSPSPSCPVFLLPPERLNATSREGKTTRPTSKEAVRIVASLNPGGPVLLFCLSPHLALFQCPSSTPHSCSLDVIIAVGDAAVHPSHHPCFFCFFISLRRVLVSLPFSLLRLLALRPHRAHAPVGLPVILILLLFVVRWYRAFC
jgi:hypothetical protein